MAVRSTDPWERLTVELLRFTSLIRQHQWDSVVVKVGLADLQIPQIVDCSKHWGLTEQRQVAKVGKPFKQFAALDWVLKPDFAPTIG